MITVQSLLDSKPKELFTVGPGASVYEALEIMAQRDIGALVVVDGQKVVGVFSERDYARKVILKGRRSREMRVHELMSRDVLYVRPEQSVDHCMALMTKKRVRHLPVIAEGHLSGIVTIGDVVKAVIDHQEVVISELENYITGAS